MSVRRIGYDESLEGMRDELVYTRARLEADRDAAGLVSPVHEAIGRVQAGRQAQFERWDAELVAQARVDSVNYKLDGLVDEFGRVLHHIVNADHTSPRWKRYFGTDTPSTVRRLGLAAETRRVNGWVDSLKSEREPELHAIGEKLAELIKDATGALEARQKAATARADHRAREIMTLVDDINALRLSLYGELIARVATTGNDRRWPEQFFYHAGATPRRTPAEPAEPAQPAQPQ